MVTCKAMELTMLLSTERGETLNEWRRLMGQESEGGCVMQWSYDGGRREGRGLTHGETRQLPFPPTHPHLFSLVQNDEARPSYPKISIQLCKWYALFLSTLFPFPPRMVLTINGTSYCDNVILLLKSCLHNLIMWHLMLDTSGGFVPSLQKIIGIGLAQDLKLWSWVIAEWIV